MSNNEFDGPDGPLEDDHEFQETPSFKEIWKNSPLLKGLVIGAVIIVVTGFIFLSGGDEEEVVSRVKSAAEVEEVVGAAVDEQYEKALQESDRQRLVQAQQTQESFIPTPRGALKSRLLDQVEETPEEELDPLEQWRRRAELREKQRQERVETTQQVVATRQVLQQQQKKEEVNTQQIAAISATMAEQIQSILQTRTPQPAQFVAVTSPTLFDEAAALEGGEDSFDETSDADGDIEAEEEIIIIPAGEIFYGQLITTANSTVDGPILANIHSGPLRGARLIGSFSKSNGNSLILSFDLIVVDGIDYPIEAVAVDPATTSPGLATEVNHHWLTRVVLPGAASFISGIAEAFAERENTVVIAEDVVTEQVADLNTEGRIATGIQESADTIGEILEDRADDLEEPTIIVASGTPIGILFTSALTDSQ